MSRPPEFHFDRDEWFEDLVASLRLNGLDDDAACRLGLELEQIALDAAQRIRAKRKVSE